MIRGVNVHIPSVVSRIDVEPVATDGELLQGQGDAFGSYGAERMRRHINLGPVVVRVDTAIQKDHSGRGFPYHLARLLYVERFYFRR